MSDKNKELDPVNVVSYLEQQWKEATLLYLEHLIKDLNINVINYNKFFILCTIY